MKKLLMMTAVAAMACGAWAAGTYTFNLSILDIPVTYEHLTGGATCYLIRGDQVVAYVSASEYDASNPETNPVSGDVTKSSKATTHDSTGTVVIGGKNYGMNYHYISSKGYVRDHFSNDGYKDVTFNLDFTLNDSKVDKDLQEAYSSGSGDADDMKFILEDVAGGYYQEFSSVEFNAASTTTPNFQTTGTFIDNVPEPTSGLLVLLGMAGLALRRRRAA